MRYILLNLCFSFSALADAQLYRVFLNDKGEITRGVDLTELPVPTQYLNSIDEHCDSIWMVSNWLNYALVESNHFPSDLLKLSFVNRIEKLEPLKSVSLQIFDNDSMSPSAVNEHRQWQIDTLGYQYFKEKNINGKGIVIAIIDAGFNSADESNAFKDIFSSGRVLKTYDFIDMDSNVFHGAYHGTAVWSCIAGNLNNQPNGLATGASFILLRSEDQKTETMADEDRWIQAVEKAYEWGADIVNSSVGFTNTLHSRDQVNGQTLISKAADIAASKGMLIVVSAGNEWITAWKTLAIPADAEGVIAVGGIDKEGNHSYFSSVGPTADGRAKPDVVAPGTCVIVKGNEFLLGNGTSYAAPLVTGYLACMLELNGKENFVKDSLKFYGGLYPYFDYIYGYGVPRVIMRSSFMDLVFQLYYQVDKVNHQIYCNVQDKRFTTKGVLLKIAGEDGTIKFSKTIHLPKHGACKIPTTKRKNRFVYTQYYNAKETDTWTFWLNGTYVEF